MFRTFLGYEHGSARLRSPIFPTVPERGQPVNILMEAIFPSPVLCISHVFLAASGFDGRAQHIEKYLEIACLGDYPAARRPRIESLGHDENSEAGATEGPRRQPEA
jgi:hypothetical protein